MAQHRDSYGSFGTTGPGPMPPGSSSHEVIDEDELRDWTQNVKPEDFGDGKK